MVNRKLFLMILCVGLMATGTLAVDIVDQSNVGAMPPPLGNDTIGIAGISYNLWEAQSITPGLPIMTGMDFGALKGDHPWNSLPNGTIVEARVYETTAGVPDTLLASVQMPAPIAPSGGDTFVMSFRFNLAVPLDVSAYVGVPSSLAIALVIPNNLAGEINTLHDPGALYPDGATWTSANQGASWSLNGVRDQVFRIAQCK